MTRLSRFFYGFFYNADGARGRKVRNRDVSLHSWIGILKMKQGFARRQTPAHPVVALSQLCLCFLNRPVIIAVIAVRVMQVTIYEIIDVIAMRHRGVAAVRAVLVRLLVPLASVLRRAVGRIGRADFERVFLDLVSLHVMQVAIVQVIDMAFVHDARVAAAWAVLMSVPLVMVRHDQSPWSEV